MNDHQHVQALKPLVNAHELLVELYSDMTKKTARKRDMNRHITSLEKQLVKLRKVVNE